MTGYNPLYSVDGVPLVAPTSYEWGLQDVSKEESGRDQNISMSKGRIGQIRQLQLEWQNVSIKDGSAILRAFNPEYVTVRYLDAMAGTMVQELMYVGDRGATLWDTKTARWKSISFTIISKEGVML